MLKLALIELFPIYWLMWVLVPSGPPLVYPDNLKKILLILDSNVFPIPLCSLMSANAIVTRCNECLTEITPNENHQRSLS